MDEPVFSPAQRPAWGVADLLMATSDALGTRFGALCVRGELSGFSRAASGHCYFSLKDSEGAPALLRCAMFRRAALLAGFSPADGQQVELRGRLGVYEARGELQMVVESMQRLGSGALYEEFLRRRSALQAEGLFDAARKQPVPAYPRRLALITSLAAAALRDVLTTLQRRSPQVQVVILPSLVQGAEAPASLVSALQAVSRVDGIDTVLLVRGGGSLEDLWAFNDERVVRAVAACPLPLICGVGHETDITLCDLAADVRAATPTAAAELAAPSCVDALSELTHRESRLQRALSRVLQQQAQRLDHLGQRLGQPGKVLLLQGRRLDDLEVRGLRALKSCVERENLRLEQWRQRRGRALDFVLQQQRLRLQAAQGSLLAHDPKAVLRRGYAWVELPSGQPVVSVKELAPGQTVKAVWADGHALTEVQSVVPLLP